MTYKTKNELVEALYASVLSCSDVFYQAEKCRLKTAEKTYEWFFKVLLYRPGQGDTSLIRWLDNILAEIGLEDHSCSIYDLRNAWKGVFESQADWFQDDSNYKPDSLALYNNQFIREWRKAWANAMRKREAFDIKSHEYYMCMRQYDIDIERIRNNYWSKFQPFWVQLIADVYKAAPSWEEFSEALSKHEAEMAEEV